MDLLISPQMVEKFKDFLQRHVREPSPEKYRYYNGKLTKWKSTKEKWNQIAQTWGSIEVACGPTESWLNEYGEIISRSAVFPAGSVILSAGSGPALVEIFLAKEVFCHCTVVCLDYAKKMSAEGQKVAQYEKVFNINFCTGNVLDIPIQSRSIDYAMAVGLLEHLTEKEVSDTLREFDRVLRLPREQKEGQIFIGTTDWVKNQVGDKIAF